MQEKIDMHISVDFTKSFETMAEGQRIVILEIENTIWFLSDVVIDDFEEPLMSLTVFNQQKKMYVNKYLYVRKFGLEFLDFLCKTHDVILYTTLDAEVINAIIGMFQQFKRNIQFLFVVAGRSFLKHIHGRSKSIKSLNKFINENTADKFLILDCESLSYLAKFEDIFIPILPIHLSHKISSDNDQHELTSLSKTNRLRPKRVMKRQSSQKLIWRGIIGTNVQDGLNNHCLFYLKQLLAQSFGLEYTNTELLKSVSLSWIEQQLQKRDSS